MAEGVRFELTEGLKTLNGFRGRRLKPLGHPSAIQVYPLKVVLNNLFKSHCQGWYICRISWEYAPLESQIIKGGPTRVPGCDPFVPLTRTSLASAASCP